MVKEKYFLDALDFYRYLELDSFSSTKEKVSSKQLYQF